MRIFVWPSFSVITLLPCLGLFAITVLLDFTPWRTGAGFLRLRLTHCCQTFILFSSFLLPLTVLVLKVINVLGVVGSSCCVVDSVGARASVSIECCCQLVALGVLGEWGPWDQIGPPLTFTIQYLITRECVNQDALSYLALQWGLIGPHLVVCEHRDGVLMLLTMVSNNGICHVATLDCILVILATLLPGSVTLSNVYRGCAPHSTVHTYYSVVHTSISTWTWQHRAWDALCVATLLISPGGFVAHCIC